VLQQHHDHASHARRSSHLRRWRRQRRLESPDAKRVQRSLEYRSFILFFCCIYFLYRNINILSSKLLKALTPEKSQRVMDGSRLAKEVRIYQRSF
jgi:hypothetical protein